MSTTIQTPKEFWSTHNSLYPSRERIPHVLRNGSISTSPSSKANLLNSFFSSCFSDDQGDPVPARPPLAFRIYPTFRVQRTKSSLLCSLKCNLICKFKKKCVYLAWAGLFLVLAVCEACTQPGLSCSQQRFWCSIVQGICNQLWYVTNFGSVDTILLLFVATYFRYCTHIIIQINI